MQPVTSIEALVSADADSEYVFEDTAIAIPTHETIKVEADGSIRTLSRNFDPAPPRRIVKLHNGFAQRAVISGWNQLTGAVYDSNGVLVPESKVRNGQNCPERHAAETMAQAPKRSGRHIYLGHFNAVYGHFVLETIARCWAVDLINDKDARLVFLKIRRYDLENTGYPLQFFKMMGIDPDRIDIINEDTVFETIYVPAAAADLGVMIHPKQHEIYRQLVSSAISGAASKAQRRLFLSRSRLKTGYHRYFNETEMEAVMAEAGFEILHPQDMSIGKQLAAYGSASEIAGAVSSALHNSVFAPSDCRITAFDGRSGVGGSAYSVQQQICASKGQPLDVIRCEQAFTIETGNSTRFGYLARPVQLVEFFHRQFGKKPDPKFPEPAAERASRVAMGICTDMAHWLVRYDALSQALVAAQWGEALGARPEDIATIRKRVEWRLKKFEDKALRIVVFPQNARALEMNDLAEMTETCRDLIIEISKDYVFPD